ncbi:hypothetical protein HDR58_05645 [bacterium]|nr:hypothetical protein [bacterium]
MSAIEKINQLSHRIFNTSVTEQNVARTSNPFAASNFQKNILTEDVFESSNAKEMKNINFTGNISAHSKRIYSTFVGSINDFGSRFAEGIESIKALYGRMKDSLVNTWNRIQEIGNTEIKVDGAAEAAKELLARDITSFFGKSHENSISKMSKMDPHSEVKPMFQNALSVLEAEMMMVA